MKQELFQVLRDCSLEKLVGAMRILALRCYKYRRANNGYVPPRIFPSVLGISGIATAIEVIVEIGSQTPRQFALKLRDGRDTHGWPDQYEVTGVTGRMNVGVDELTHKLQKELFGDQQRLLCLEQLEFLGVTIQNEPERLVSCWTVLFLLKIQDPTELSGNWRVFSDPYSPEIIDHHREALRWVLDPKRQRFADLRLHRDTDWRSEA